MADTTASSPGANCLEKLKSYVRTQKGVILAAEIVSKQLVAIVQLIFKWSQLLTKLVIMCVKCA